MLPKTLAQWQQNVLPPGLASLENRIFQAVNLPPSSARCCGNVDRAYRSGEEKSQDIHGVPFNSDQGRGRRHSRFRCGTILQAPRSLTLSSRLFPNMFTASFYGQIRLIIDYCQCKFHILEIGDSTPNLSTPSPQTEQYMNLQRGGSHRNTSMTAGYPLKRSANTAVRTVRVRPPTCSALCPDAVSKRWSLTKDRSACGTIAR